MPTFDEVLANMFNPDYIGGLSNPNMRNMVASAMLVKNQPFAKPGPWQTQLSPTLEQLFQLWESSDPRILQYHPESYTPDYDLRGFFQDMLAGKTAAQLKEIGGKLYYPDQFLTPYSTGFGPDSQYWYSRPGQK